MRIFNTKNVNFFLPVVVDGGTVMVAAAFGPADVVAGVGDSNSSNVVSSHKIRHFSSILTIMEFLKLEFSPSGAKTSSKSDLQA
jgi:hypothetical protein